MEREVGGGIGMGNICKPMAVSFQCMTKSTTKKKTKKELLRRHHPIIKSGKDIYFFKREGQKKCCSIPYTEV